MFHKCMAFMFRAAGPAVLGVLLINGIWLTWLRYDALEQFTNSRPGDVRDVESFAFLSREVRYGMPEEAVDSLMQGADEVLTHMGAPNPEGFSNHYHFSYGRPFRSFFVGSPSALCTEQAIVYFDPESRAIAMTVFVFRRYGTSSEYSVDLENRTVRRED